MSTSQNDRIHAAIRSFLDTYGVAQGLSMGSGTVGMFDVDTSSALNHSQDPSWFTLRVFNAEAELHIERLPGSTNLRIDVLDEPAAQQNGWLALGTYQRLLWSIRPAPGGAYELGDTRTAVLPVPITVGTKQQTTDPQAVLSAIEYVAYDNQGNATVICERLTGFHLMQEEHHA